MTGAHSGRCWALILRVGRREEMGTVGLREKEEIKQFASKMNSQGSTGQCASSSVSLQGCRVPCWSWAGVRMSLQSVLKGRGVLPVHVEFQQREDCFSSNHVVKAAEDVFWDRSENQLWGTVDADFDWEVSWHFEFSKSDLESVRRNTEHLICPWPPPWSFRCSCGSRRSKVNNTNSQTCSRLFGRLTQAPNVSSVSPTLIPSRPWYLFATWKKCVSYNLVFGIWPNATLRCLPFQALALPFPLCVCRVQSPPVQTVPRSTGCIFLLGLTHTVLFQEDFLSPPSLCVEETPLFAKYEL